MSMNFLLLSGHFGLSRRQPSDPPPFLADQLSRKSKFSLVQMKKALGLETPTNTSRNIRCIFQKRMRGKKKEGNPSAHLNSIKPQAELVTAFEGDSDFSPGPRKKNKTPPFHTSNPLAKSLFPTPSPPPFTHTFHFANASPSSISTSPTTAKAIVRFNRF